MENSKKDFGPNIYASNRHHQAAKKHGFKFKGGEKRYLACIERKEKIVEDLGEQPMPFKVILSFLCIGVALVFAYIEANNVQATIIGALNFGETGAMIAGFAFAAAGLVAGEMLASSSSWKTDEYSGRKTPRPRFWLGLAFAITYLAGQYYLASRAGGTTDGELAETVGTMKWFVLGIAVSELLFGAAFLTMALKMFTLFVNRVATRFPMYVMNRHSKLCEEEWQRYCFANDGQNLEETPSIRDARRFYNEGGFNGEYFSK